MTKGRGILVAVAAWLAACAAAADEYDVSADGMRMVDGRFTFTGDVLVTGGGLRVEADEIEVFEGVYDISGSPAKMSYSSSGAKTSLSGSSIVFSEEEARVEMGSGGVVSRGTMRVAAGRISYSLEGRSLSAGGGVDFNDGDVSASGSAVTAGGGDSLLLRLTGSPAVIDMPGGEDVRLQASAASIEYDETRGKVRLQGGVVANLGRERLVGETIDYDVRQGSFVAEPDEDGRVHATIQTR